MENFLKIFRKTTLTILIIFVSIIVFLAIVQNLNSIDETNIEKYAQIRIEEPLRIDDIVNNYSEPENREKFLDELKKINSIESCQYISNKTLIIPIFKSN